MARIYKGLHAPSVSTDLPGLSGQRHASSVFACVERLQVSNVPVRDPFPAGVQILPKSVIMVNYVERGNPVTSPGAIPGRHYRKACFWRDRIEKLEQANAVGKAGG